MQAKQFGLLAAKILLKFLAVFQEFIACLVQAVLGAFGHAHIQALGKARALKPINQRPLAQRFHKPVYHHGLGDRHSPFVHPQLGKLTAQPQCVPGCHARQPGAELDHVDRFDFFGNHTVERLAPALPL